jgi:hypothetical protein
MDKLRERMNSLLKKISTCVRWKVAALSWKCKFRGAQFLYNFDLGLGGGHMEQGVCHNGGLGHLHLKSILRQKKKNYGNSNISPCKNIIL